VSLGGLLQLVLNLEVLRLSQNLPSYILRFVGYRFADSQFRLKLVCHQILQEILIGIFLLLSVSGMIFEIQRIQRRRIILKQDWTKIAG